ncbi:MAG: hypothetical protein Kow0069_04690 [Promethearchaeota archaeon]
MPTKLNDRLANYLSALANQRDFPFLADELVEHFADKCRRCQYDRMICAISPMCFRRHWLNVLIKNGVKPDEEIFPKFCYSQQVSNVQRYLQKKRTLYPPFDSLMFLEDFLGLVFPHHKRRLALYLKRGDWPTLREKLDQLAESAGIGLTWGRDFAVMVPPGDYLGPEHNVFFLDERGGYAIVDPRREELYYTEQVEVLVRAFSSAYDVAVDFKSAVPGEGEEAQADWRVDFNLGALHVAADSEALNELFSSAVDDFVLSSSEVNLWITEENPSEVHVVLKIPLVNEKFSREAERVDFDKIKRMLKRCHEIQTYLSRTNEMQQQVVRHD